MPRKKGDQPFSQKEYYERRKQTLKEIKAQRYATDPEYRRKVQEASRSNYQKKREASGVAKIDGVTYEINGVTYVTKGYIAKRTGLSTGLLNYYHEAGFLPVPKRILDYTHKMYPLFLAEAIIPVLQEYMDGEFKDGKEIKERVKASMGEIDYEEATE